MFEFTVCRFIAKFLNPLLRELLMNVVCTALKSKSTASDLVTLMRWPRVLSGVRC